MSKEKTPKGAVNSALRQTAVISWLKNLKR